MRTTFKVASVATLLLLLSLNVQEVSAQACKANLVVEKNRNSKSADENGATYWLELTNRSVSSSSFTIVSKNLETSCSNNNRRSSEPNVDLNLAIYGSDGNSPISESVVVGGGQTYRFRIDVTVPSGTAYNRWSCIEVQANSDLCPAGTVATTLRVFVPDPSEE